MHDVAAVTVSDEVIALDGRVLLDLFQILRQLAGGGAARDFEVVAGPVKTAVRQSRPAAGRRSETLQSSVEVAAEAAARLPPIRIGGGSWHGIGESPMDDNDRLVPHGGGAFLSTLGRREFYFHPCTGIVEIFPRVGASGRRLSIGGIVKARCREGRCHTASRLSNRATQLTISFPPGHCRTLCRRCSPALALDWRAAYSQLPTQLVGSADSDRSSQLRRQRYPSGRHS